MPLPHEQLKFNKVSRRLALSGGLLAILISVAVTVWVIVRGVGLNVLSGWTIGVTGVAGLLAIKAPRILPLLASAVLLIVGAAPAIFGGVALLYAIPLVLLLAAAVAALVEKGPK